MQTILNTDLLLNPDGSVYHLSLHPDQLADTVIIVGDPDRVGEISCYFDRVDHNVRNREFNTCTGWFGGKRITALSTGIGTDNIDIVLHELDALVNINLQTREINPVIRSLNIIRIGTSGAIQPDIPVDSFCVSTYGMGLDNLMRYYLSSGVRDEKIEQNFLDQTGWDIDHVRPYFIKGTEQLIERFSDVAIRGITATAPGFYGPQGRKLRLNLADPDIIRKLQNFNFNGERIINFEMETSALYGLSALLGHNALTLCALIANRASFTYSKDHKPVMNNLIQLVLERLV